MWAGKCGRPILDCYLSACLPRCLVHEGLGDPPCGLHSMLAAMQLLDRRLLREGGRLCMTSHVAGSVKNTRQAIHWILEITVDFHGCDGTAGLCYHDSQGRSLQYVVLLAGGAV